MSEGIRDNFVNKDGCHNVIISYDVKRVEVDLNTYVEGVKVSLLWLDGFIYIVFDLSDNGRDVVGSTRAV